MEEASSLISGLEHLLKHHITILSLFRIVNHELDESFDSAQLLLYFDARETSWFVTVVHLLILSVVICCLVRVLLHASVQIVPVSQECPVGTCRSLLPAPSDLKMR